MLLVNVVLLRTNLGKKLHVEDIEVVDHPVTCSAFRKDCLFAAVVTVECSKVLASSCGHY